MRKIYCCTESQPYVELSVLITCQPKKRRYLLYFLSDDTVVNLIFYIFYLMVPLWIRSSTYSIWWYRCEPDLLHILSDGTVVNLIFYIFYLLIPLWIWSSTYSIWWYRCESDLLYIPSHDTVVNLIFYIFYLMIPLWIWSSTYSIWWYRCKPDLLHILSSDTEIKSRLKIHDNPVNRLISALNKKLIVQRSKSNFWLFPRRCLPFRGKIYKFHRH